MSKYTYLATDAIMLLKSFAKQARQADVDVSIHTNKS